jgi:hypothetical protein
MQEEEAVSNQTMIVAILVNFNPNKPLKYFNQVSNMIQFV